MGEGAQGVRDRLHNLHDAVRLHEQLEQQRLAANEAIVVYRKACAQGEAIVSPRRERCPLNKLAGAVEHPHHLPADQNGKIRRRKYLRVALAQQPMRRCSATVCHVQLSRIKAGGK